MDLPVPEFSFKSIYIKRFVGLSVSQSVCHISPQVTNNFLHTGEGGGANISDTQEGGGRGQTLYVIGGVGHDDVDE